VATDEIRVGDNDTLAALVTSLVDADALFLLSDVDGLYDRNPAVYPDAHMIPRVERIDATVRAMAGGVGSPGGTGGMRTKLVAAEIATGSGAALWIANGRRPNVLAECVAGAEGVGTYFAPLPTRPSARKRWLAWASGEPRGTITVNACARRALEEEGRSLLPVGIVGARGMFAPGDLVAVGDEGGVVFARGITRYSADDVRRVAGLPTTELAAALNRENDPRDEVIHRDSLVLLPAAGLP
jgi:glutamate 5-kinase